MILTIFWIVMVIVSALYPHTESAVSWAYHLMLFVGYLYICWSVYDACMKDAEIGKMIENTSIKDEVPRDNLCFVTTLIVGCIVAIIHLFVLFFVGGLTLPTMGSIIGGIFVGSFIGKLANKLQ